MRPEALSLKSNLGLYMQILVAAKNVSEVCCCRVTIKLLLVFAAAKVKLPLKSRCTFAETSTELQLDCKYTHCSDKHLKLQILNCSRDSQWHSSRPVLCWQSGLVRWLQPAQIYLCWIFRNTTKNNMSPLKWVLLVITMTNVAALPLIGKLPLRPP